MDWCYFYFQVGRITVVREVLYSQGKIKDRHSSFSLLKYGIHSSIHIYFICFKDIFLNLSIGSFFKIILAWMLQRTGSVEIHN